MARHAAAELGEWVLDLCHTAVLVREGAVGDKVKWVGAGGTQILQAAYDGTFTDRRASVSAAKAAIWGWLAMGQWGQAGVLVRRVILTQLGHIGEEVAVEAGRFKGW